MGWDTYLSVGGRLVQSWRKYAPHLPRLLFRSTDAAVEDAPEDGRAVNAARYECSCREALAALAEAGLDHAFITKMYADLRTDQSFAVGMLMGSLMRDGLASEDIQAEVQKKLSQKPSHDLDSLGAALAADWRAKPEGESIVTDLLAGFDGHWTDFASKVISVAEEHRIHDPFAAGRAAEAFHHLQESAPMLCWPMSVSILLHQLASDETLELDLTEDAEEHVAAGYAGGAQDYVDRYWRTASETMANEALFFGRMFTVLANSGSQLGREYWLGRSARLLDQARAATNSAGKGALLEAAFEALVRAEEGRLEVIEKNLRNRDEELDLVVANQLPDPFWTALGSPLIFVECKNWSKKVDVNEARVFETKIADHGSLCKVGIFVALGGITGPFRERAAKLQSKGFTVMVITGADLDQMLTERTPLSTWLLREGVKRTLKNG